MAMIAIGFIICLASSGRSVPGVVYFGVFVAVIGESYYNANELDPRAKDYTRDLSCFPWKRHLDQRQSSWRLQACCRNGYLYWDW